MCKMVLALAHRVFDPVVEFVQLELAETMMESPIICSNGFCESQNQLE